MLTQHGFDCFLNDLNPYKTYNQQQEIMRIRYRLGQGETAEFLESQVRGEGLRGQLVELENLLGEKVRELGRLIGDELNLSR